MCNLYLKLHRTVSICQLVYRYFLTYIDHIATNQRMIANARMTRVWKEAVVV
jgi:hypothetical protein